MLAMAKVGPEDVVFDLGCGDGRIVIRAAQQRGARGVGIDLDEKLVAAAGRRAREAGVADRVKFRAQDATKADFSTATVVTLYLLPESNALLRPLLDEQLRPGARVISHDYTIEGWRHRLTDSRTVAAEDGKDHILFLYVR
ncbi:MAG: class I SAM-dependent methyltransferase [Deltaproteobacteria bacterium]|nr:class I SAM-dependent methyltransferase [Deltaproteobacteria bacterium]MBW2530992.1 class I SAM-dependent methyltransferase [Deltaproteobacteria bacterium]